MKLFSNRAGKIVKNNNFKKDGTDIKNIQEYEYFVPTSLFDVKIKMNDSINKLLFEAYKQLVNLNNIDIK